MKKIEVTWVDSATKSGWMATEYALGEMEDFDVTCHSVGYKFGETDTLLFLVSSYADTSIHTLHAIPKVAIKKIKKLK